MVNSMTAGVTLRRWLVLTSFVYDLFHQSRGTAYLELKALQDNGMRLSLLGSLYDDIKELLKRFPDFSVNHVGRNCNSLAHDLASVSRTNQAGGALVGALLRCLNFSCNEHCNRVWVMK